MTNKKKATCKAARREHATTLSAAAEDLMYEIRAHAEAAEDEYNAAYLLDLFSCPKALKLFDKVAEQERVKCLKKS